MATRRPPSSQPSSHPPTIQMVAEAAYQIAGTAFAKAIADLALIGFFYLLLRVGEYTLPQEVTQNGKKLVLLGPKNNDFKSRT